MKHKLVFESIYSQLARSCKSDSLFSFAMSLLFQFPPTISEKFHKYFPSVYLSFLRRNANRMLQRGYVTVCSSFIQNHTIFSFGKFPQVILCLNLHILFFPPLYCNSSVMRNIWKLQVRMVGWERKNRRYCLSSHSYGASHEMGTLIFPFHTSDLGRWLPLGEGDNLISIHFSFHFFAKSQQICFRFCGITYSALVI